MPDSPFDRYSRDDASRRAWEAERWRSEKPYHDELARPAEPRRPKAGEEKDSDEDGEGEDEKKDKKDDKKQKRTRWPLIALIVVVILAIIGGVIYWLMTRDQISTDDAYTDGRAVIVAPHVSGYVTALRVDDNQFVHAGDVLLTVDSRDYEAARDQAAGQVAAVEAQRADAQLTVEKAETTYPAQLMQAQGQLAQAEGQFFRAQSDYRRQHSVARGATSQQDIDASTATLRQAQGQVDQARAQVQQASLVSQNVAQAQAAVKQLDGQLAQAKASLQQAELNLSYTKVTAPQDGWITKRNVELGNYLQPGQQILSLVVPEIWVIANFKETQLTRMRPGQRVRIDVDAYPDLDITGHVDSVQLGSGTKFTAFPPENATGNFVKIVQRVPVKIVIDSGLDANRPLPLGLSVTPTVLLK